MWPAAIAAAMLGMVSVLGGASVRTAHAATVAGDICSVQVDSRVTKGTDGQGNTIYNVPQKGVAYGLVFRVADGTGFTVLDFGGTGNTQEDEVVDTENSGPNVGVAVDSERGSARITSKAEIVNVENGLDAVRPVPAPGTGSDVVGSVPNVAHLLVNPASGTGTQYLDTMSPRWFNDADGNQVDSINQWLADNGYPQFANNAVNVCGQSSINITAGDLFCPPSPGGTAVLQSCTEYFDDSWGFIDFTCIESGTFHIDIYSPGSTENTDASLKFSCPGQADTATISVLYPTLETNPATAGLAVNHGETPVTVTVLDADGNRIDGVHVTLSTDNCTFVRSGSSSISPAAGGKTVEIVSDTDAAGPDQNFLADNPLQTQAGTAEATLDCDGPLNTFGPGGTGNASPAPGTPGTAHISAVVDRAGADIALSATVTVIGPTSANGLTLALSSSSVTCGNPITATAHAVDANGVAVSDGTVVYFTTDTSSGVVGGLPAGGAQGAVPTVGGSATANIATDPGNPGTHTVIAYVLNGAGGVAVQSTATYNCTVPAAPAPTVTVPSTGTGTGAITPPNTGDAGLAAGNSGSSSLFVIAAAVVMALAGFASFKFARR